MAWNMNSTPLDGTVDDAFRIKDNGARFTNMLVNARANCEPAHDAWCTWRVLVTQRGFQNIDDADSDYVLMRFRSQELVDADSDDPASPTAEAQQLAEAMPIPPAAPATTTDTNLTIVTRNIRGLADNLPALFRCRSDMYLIQEVDLIEHRVNEMKAAAAQAGYQFISANPPS